MMEKYDEYYTSVNINGSVIKGALREKCPNTEFLLVRIFLHPDRIWRFTE